MKKKQAGQVTLEGLDVRLDGFEETLGEFKGTFNEFKSTLGEFRGTLGEFKGTFTEIGEMLGFVVDHMATKEDLAELRKELKGDAFILQTQVNSIEMNIREMKHERLELRVADLEEKVFGKTH